MFRQGKINSVNIINACTTELCPQSGNYTILTLEIIMDDNLSKIESYTKRAAMLWYGDYFSKKDLDEYYEGKKGWVFNSTNAAMIGGGALVGGLSYGGLGFFAGAAVGCVMPQIVHQLHHGVKKLQ